MEERPKRRKRYPGTHPRKFDQKYKELAPEKYPDIVSKVAGRGQTPAGMHRSIMVQEIVEVLRPAADDIVLDCTLGYGGHSEALGKQLGPNGRLLATDLDKEELERTRARLEAAGIPVRAYHTNFAGIGNVLAEEHLDGVDVLLADLGVSSMQLDRPERGFSFKSNGPLDMRMDRSRGQPATQFLAAISEEDLTKLLTDLGDEPDAAQVAQKIVAAVKAGHPPKKTRDLVNLVLLAKRIDPAKYKRKSAFDTHPAARTFQAVRMAVNRETANLQHLMRTLPLILHAGGRAAILTFHSGEERIVGDALRTGLAQGVYSAGTQDPIRPSPKEVHDNPRARSARLWWVRRSLEGC